MLWLLCWWWCLFCNTIALDMSQALCYLMNSHVTFWTKVCKRCWNWIMWLVILCVSLCGSKLILMSCWQKEGVTKLPSPPKEPTFSCPICMGPLVEEMSTRCGHIFCKTCIKTAISTQSKCPTCRKNVTVRELIRIFLPSTSWGSGVMTDYVSFFRCFISLNL